MLHGLGRRVMTIRRYFYDCEFLENGRTIELISIGIVSNTGREYYAVNRNAPWRKIRKHPWLMANVVPHLPKVHGDMRHFMPRNWLCDMRSTLVRPRERIAEEVRMFLTGGAGPSQLWSYFSAYDHVVLAQLWGPMALLPPGIPMRTGDIAQEAARLGLADALPPRPTALHNAIEDARWAKQAWEFLRRHPGGRVHGYAG